MELRESIEDINKKLKDEFGLAFNGWANFRVVFSEDQFEKRWTTYTDEGFELLEPEVRELPKYKQYIREKYILERLVPAGIDTDLVEKVTYEPAWVFQDKDQNYLPPFYDGCKLVIEALISQTREPGQTFAKYKDKNVLPEERAAMLKKVQDDLFGNETDIGDALAYDYGVGYTGPEFKDTKEEIQKVETKVNLSKLVH